jgi:hypothetical protein
MLEDAQESEFNMNHVTLESPFATLRSMGARANDQVGGASNPQGRYRVSSDHAKRQDPIACGILTAKEAERAAEL